MILASQVTTYFSDNWLSVLIAVIVTLGGGGGLAAILRNRSEGPKILVDAAQGAVVVQGSVIEDLREQLAAYKVEMEAQKAEIAELRTHMAELNSLRTKVRDLEQKNDELRSENTFLSSQIRALTRIVHENEQKAEMRSGNGNQD
jgi:cell shape-determining protein MreC